MTAIEFTAQAGKTFSVQLYDVVTGDAIGAATAGVTDDPPTLYRADVGAATGDVYVVATATNLRVAGYADLNSPVNGYSPLTDTPASSVEATLSQIKAKTDLIGTGSATVSAPVATNGTLSEIIIGDDYLAAHNRQLQWTVDKPSNFNMAEATCWFGIDGLSPIEGSIDDNNDGTLTLTFEILRTDTDSHKPSRRDWNVAIHDASGNEITRVKSNGSGVALVKKFT